MPHPAFRPLPRESLSILVVDEHRDAADSLAELLQLCGHDVRVARNAADALRADPPDVVILELRLAGVSGWELVRQIRERKAVKPPLLVAVTTCATAEDRRRSAEAGTHIHLVKPVHPAVLIGLLRRFAEVVAPPRTSF